MEYFKIQTSHDDQSLIPIWFINLSPCTLFAHLQILSDINISVVLRVSNIFLIAWVDKNVAINLICMKGNSKEHHFGCRLHLDEDMRGRIFCHIDMQGGGMKENETVVHMVPPSENNKNNDICFLVVQMVQHKNSVNMQCKNVICNLCFLICSYVLTCTNPGWHTDTLRSHHKWQITLAQRIA